MTLLRTSALLRTRLRTTAFDMNKLRSAFKAASFAFNSISRLHSSFACAQKSNFALSGANRRFTSRIGQNDPIALYKPYNTAVLQSIIRQHRRFSTGSIKRRHKQAEQAKQVDETQQKLTETWLDEQRQQNLRNDHRNERRRHQGEYSLTFTCEPCQSRDSYRVSHQAYHHGTVLIECSNCKVRHLIADHLKIFSDTSVTVEEILRRKGEHVHRGRGAIVDGELVELSIGAKATDIPTTGSITAGATAELSTDTTGSRE